VEADSVPSLLTPPTPHRCSSIQLNPELNDPSTSQGAAGLIGEFRTLGGSQPRVQEPKGQAGLAAGQEPAQRRELEPEQLVGSLGAEGLGGQRLGNLPPSVNNSVGINFRPGACFPVIAGRLYFTAHRDDDETMRQIVANPKIFFFSTDLHESYIPFCADFGPVNLLAVVNFCEKIEEKLGHPKLQKRPLVYYTLPDPEIVTNLCFLFGAFLTLNRGLKPQDIDFFKMFSPETNPILGFRDATYMKSIYDLSIQSCLEGLATAKAVGWFNPLEFDRDEYEELEDPEVADMHQLCHKFIAFRGPEDAVPEEEELGFPAQHYIPIFKYKGVTAVIRLNEPNTYNAQVFKDAGIEHFDLYFDDCTVPPVHIVQKFLQIVETTEGLVAVHCTAGLGRTGTLIALWMMKHYGTHAAETMAWLRIVRPGSVIGPQQLFLTKFENFDWRKLADPAAGPQGPRGLAAAAHVASTNDLEGAEERALRARELGAMEAGAGESRAPSEGSGAHRRSSSAASSLPNSSGLFDSLLSAQMADQVKKGMKARGHRG